MVAPGLVHQADPPSTVSHMKTILPLLALGMSLAGCVNKGDPSAPPRAATNDKEARTASKTMTDECARTDEEWKKILTPEQYQVLRGQGTERAFTGKYWDNKKNGIYVCAGCAHPLFDSTTKFDSGSGWPSFYKPLEGGHVATKSDSTLGMVRTEVLCSQCGGHLGHQFPDGPQPTGQRYCINSAALKFQARPDAEKK